MITTNHRPVIVLAALFVTAVATPVQAALANWHGRYIWEEGVGRHGGTSSRDSIAAFITYTLSIGPGNGPTGCLLNGQGFQTNKRIICTATPQRDALVVKFHAFGPDNMFADKYIAGQALFTLTSSPTGIVTRLQALAPSSRTTRRSGELFRRAR